MRINIARRISGSSGATFGRTAAPLLTLGDTGRIRSRAPPSFLAHSKGGSMRIALLASVVVAAVAASGAAFAQSMDKKADKKSDGMGKSMSVQLQPQNNSGEKGTVKL